MKITDYRTNNYLDHKKVKRINPPVK